jgi:hypothetical protein
MTQFGTYPPAASSLGFVTSRVAPMTELIK